LEGTCLDINEILPQHFAGGTEVSHRKNEWRMNESSQDSCYPSWDLNHVAPEYEYSMSLLWQSSQSEKLLYQQSEISLDAEMFFKHNNYSHIYYENKQIEVPVKL
jgi:hypothetical protein